MSLTPPSELTFTLPDRTIPRGEKRQSSAVEQLELPLKKRHKTAHESEQAEAGPSTSARITMPDISSPSLVHDLSKGQALISSVSSADQQTLSALSTTELLNFMRVDMSIHIVSGRQGLAYHGTWVRHTNTPVFPATLRRLPFEPSDISTYAYSVIVAATNFIQWQLADIREVTDRIDAGYPFFGPRLSELAALQKLQAKPGVSLYELVSVHYPFPRLVGNVALIVARVEDLIDELNRYQVAMRDEDSGSLDPPATNLLPVEERNCPARVAILMGELTEAYGLDAVQREDGPEPAEQAQQKQVLPQRKFNGFTQDDLDSPRDVQSATDPPETFDEDTRRYFSEQGSDFSDDIGELIAILQTARK